ncbi:MAG TPA: hypothetical protein VH442_04115, partial [Micromonosporaceae bacterium]
ADLPPDNELFTDFDSDRFDTSPMAPPRDTYDDLRPTATAVDDSEDEDDDELDEEEASVAA